MLRLLCILIISAIATILLASAVIIHLPFDRGDTLIWSGLMVPIIWACLVVFAYWYDRAWRGFAVLGAVTAVSALLIVFRDSGGT
ncbi:MAG: hypothetical protein AAGE89_00125 [Pseudomonadota bacterium]